MPAAETVDRIVRGDSTAAHVDVGADRRLPSSLSRPACVCLSVLPLLGGVMPARTFVGRSTTSIVMPRPGSACALQVRAVGWNGAAA